MERSIDVRKRRRARGRGNNYQDGGITETFVVRLQKVGCFSD
jgi:hypothetical protein